MTNSSQDDDFVVAVLCGLFEKKNNCFNFFFERKKEWSDKKIRKYLRKKLMLRNTQNSGVSNSNIFERRTRYPRKTQAKEILPHVTEG
jgi:hypothetical protein